MLSISMHMKNLVKIHSFVLKILSGHEILTSFNDHNSVINCRKWMPNNTKLDIVSINDYANVGQNQLIRSQDNERKRNSDVVQDRDSVTN